MSKKELEEAAQLAPWLFTHAVKKSSSGYSLSLSSSFYHFPVQHHRLGVKYPKQPKQNKWKKRELLNYHHEGDVEGEPEDEDELPLLVLESLPEVPKDLASLRETEQASLGSFFIGVKGGVVGLEGPEPDGVG